MHGPTVKAPNMPLERGMHTNDTGYASAAPTDDHPARASFTMRRMLPWQIWALAISAVAVVVLGWLYL